MNRRKGYLVLMMFLGVVLTACNQGNDASSTTLPGEAGAVALYKNSAYPATLLT